MAKFCMKCGASLDEHVKFCKACGTPIDGKVRKDTSAHTVKMSQLQLETSKQVKDVQRNSGNSSKVVIVALVIAALCGGGGYYYYQAQQTIATEVKSLSKDGKDAAESTSSKVEADEKSKEGQAKEIKQAASEHSKDKDKPVSVEYSKNGESTAMSPEKSLAANGAGQAANSAKDTVVSFHNRITNGDYRGAYNLLTLEMQNTMGNFDNWAKGFSTTIESRATDLQVVSLQDNVAEISFVLVARDKRSGGDIEERRFRSTARVVNDGGSWKITSIKNKRL